MRILTTFPGTGTLGGVVGVRGRAGLQITARSARTQPRSTSQTNNRAITGALSQAWRGLTASQRASWAAIASGAGSGFNAFVSCNRNLLTLGQTELLSNAPARPIFPPVTALVATPIYNAPTPPRGLWGWQLDTVPEVPFGWGLVARATQVLSPTKAHIRGSDLRIIAAARNLPTPALIPATSWQAIWGAGPYTGNVTWQLTLVDLVSGFASRPYRALSAYSATLPAGPSTWQTTIQFNGTTVEVTYNQIYTQESEPIAGP